MDDEEFAIFGPGHDHLRHALRGYVQHAVIVGWGRGRTTTLSMRVWKMDGSYVQPHRPV
jgi:hypothetical protein